MLPETPKQIFERRLLDLIDASPNQHILLSALPKVYENRFGAKINHIAHGHAKLKGLLVATPAVTMEGTGGYTTVKRTGSMPNGSSRHLSLDLPKSLKTTKREVLAFADSAATILPAAELRKILTALEKHPEGMTISQLLRESPGLLRYLKNQSANFSPLRFAASLPGLRVGTGNKSSLIFLDPETKAPMLIDTAEQLELVRGMSLFARNEPDDINFDPNKESIVAVDCEGVPEALHLIQIGTRTTTFVFDCIKLGVDAVCEALRELLTDPKLTKLFHDLHKDAAALAEIGGVAPLRGTLDTQLAMEALTGELHIGFNQMLKHFDISTHSSKDRMHHRMQSWWEKNGTCIFSQRPLPPDLLQYAADDVSLLVRSQDELLDKLGKLRPMVQRASDARALKAPETQGARQICFDVGNDYAIVSLELLQEQRPDDMIAPTPLKVSEESDVLLDMLPLDLVADLVGRTSKLSDIVIDKGRAPQAWIDGKRVILGGEERMVQQSDIDKIIGKSGKFGADNRAGLERQLHRISAMRNRNHDIIGLTMRVGRHVRGNATIISDLLFAQSEEPPSILFLGEPGSGKTTIVREATRLLAERGNVCIVDTSNEIAGDGDVPHPCVGFARRMMVETIDKQAGVMIECVQNHTPTVMVIDEIGRPKEVEAARTCKQRGVRLIASAHGDLRKLIKNTKLRGLIGGVETVTLGDDMAKQESKKKGGGVRKLKAQRSGPPTFDRIVELRRGALDEWKIVLDVADAVDRVLEGKLYRAQRRTRNPGTGAMQMELDYS